MAFIDPAPAVVSLCLVPTAYSLLVLLGRVLKQGVFGDVDAFVERVLRRRSVSRDAEAVSDWILLHGSRHRSNLSEPLKVLLYVKGAVAQLGERLVCNQEVEGSIPFGSSAHAESCVPSGGDPIGTENRCRIRRHGR